MKFIIVPRSDDAADVLAHTGDQLTSANKFDNYAKLSTMRNDRGFQQAGTPSEFANFEESAREIVGAESNVKIIASPKRETVATGVTVIDTDESGARALQAVLNQTDIIPDDALSLVESDVLTTDSAKEASELTREHLWHLNAIGLELARANGFKGTGAGVNVAVMDTGIADVPEIKGKVIRTIDLDTEAWKVDYQESSIDTYKYDGHGTLVAGLIAGKTVGVAPGSTITNIVLLPNGQSHVTKYILALEWAASQNSIKVINMSAGKLGYHENMRIITRVLRRLPTIIFIAIGNEGPDTSRSPGNYPEVISVGASNKERKIWAGSSGGELLLDHMRVQVPKLVAPGEGITTCVKDGTYKVAQGTSLATPIVSGIACLMLERFPDIMLHQLEAEIFSACEDLGLDHNRQGYGAANLPSSLL